MTFMAAVLNSKIAKFWSKYHFEKDKKGEKLSISKADIKLIPAMEFHNSPFIDKDLVEKILNA